MLLRMENNEKRHRSFLISLLHRLILSRIKLALPVGTANARYYRDLGVSNSRMVKSPYCVDNQHFSVLAEQARPQRHQLRQTWNVPDAAFCCLFCGKLEDKKHPGDILDALKIIKDSGQSPSVHCLFIGSGALESQLKCEAVRLDLPVTFVGFLNQRQLSSAYVAADALVLPSDCNETWGLVVNEAMACGLPAIVSDQVGCIDDLIELGRTGLTYPCRDVDALADSMLTMATNPLASQKMGHNASTLVHLLAFCRTPQ